jgi:hypothetical protein
MVRPTLERKSLRIEANYALAFWWSMIFSENRLPLFRIMLWRRPDFSWHFLH